MILSNSLSMVLH